MSENPTVWNQWFRAEVGAAFAIGAAVAGIVLWVSAPISALNTSFAVMQNQIAELKSNDLVHIELEQTKAAARLEDLQKQITANSNTLIEIETFLKQNK